MIEQEFARGRHQAARSTASPRGTSSRSSSTATRTSSTAGCRPALDQEVIWCQLFSEPDAGSDAAGIKTKATRVDGGWLVNGQKVWTSGAHVSGMGFATVRTNPDVPKHDGITMMVIDMHAEGVEVRPLKMTTGELGVQRGLLQRRLRPRRRRRRPRRRRMDRGPRHARQREREHRRRRRRRHVSAGAELLVDLYDAHPERLYGGAARIGRYMADHRRWACSTCGRPTGPWPAAGPGPEGAMTKLVLSEIGHEAAAIMTRAHRRRLASSWTASAA